MIEYKVGDLLEADERYIVHGCNAQGVMGSGVAAAIRAKYPKAYDEYRRTFEEQGNRLNLGQVIEVDCGRHVVLNAITQRYYGRQQGHVYLDYTALRKVFHHINASFPGERVAMPLIGAGLAGGDWRLISLMLNEECNNVFPVVYVLQRSFIPK